MKRSSGWLKMLWNSAGMTLTMFVTFCQTGWLGLATLISRWKYSPLRSAKAPLTVTLFVASAAPKMFSYPGVVMPTYWFRRLLVNVAANGKTTLRSGVAASSHIADNTKRNASQRFISLMVK
jgi:hypothetical protein